MSNARSARGGPLTSVAVGVAPRTPLLAPWAGSLLALISALLVLAFTAMPASAQDGASPPPPQDAPDAQAGDQDAPAAEAEAEANADEQAKSAEIADPWQRGTPRGAMRSFLEAGREADWERAAHLLDLGALSEAERAERGPVLARQLKYLLDLELWIDLDALSDEPAGRLDDKLPALRDQVGLLTRADDTPVYLDRGPREDGVPVWRLSGGTLARVPALYEQLGPPALVDRLPPVLHDTHFLELALWQWIGLILLVIAAWLVAWIGASIVMRIVKPLTMKSDTDWDDRLLGIMLGPLKLLLAVAVLNATLHLLLLSVPANSFVREASKFLVIAGVAWFALRLVDLFASVGKERFIKRGQSGAAHLVPLGARAIKVTVFVITVLATLDTFGFDVTAVIAGLGVGGLAVALAAQKTVENVFGGVSVLVDQPVRPGDFCKFGDKLGTVEDIGLRSTRIRTLDRTVVSVPNAEFSTLQIENFADRDRIRLITTLGLRYETTADQLRHVIDALRNLLVTHPRVLPDPLRVRFVNFGAYSLDIELLCFVDTKDINEFIAVREDIFLRVIDVVAASGTGFAFPSNTTYLAQDAGCDDLKREAAEAEIALLRAEGRLPFAGMGPKAVQGTQGTQSATTPPSDAPKTG